MENISRRKFIVDNAKLAGVVIGASALGTGILVPPTVEAAKNKTFVESSFDGVSDIGKNILVVYDSDYGSTAQVAVTIGKTLYDTGNSVEVRGIKNVTDIKAYDVVIIGSPIQYDKWMPDAREFVKKNREALGEKSVAYFFTCLTLSRRTEETESKAMEYANNLIDLAPGVNPVSIGQFAGSLDYSKMSLFKKMILASVLAIHNVKEGDYREWERIKSWSEELKLV